MKKAFVTLAFVITFLVPWTLRAKGRTLRVVIEGANLRVPVQIAGLPILNDFNVWAGPGTFSSTMPMRRSSTDEPDGFIIRWSQGATAEPSKRLPRYQVSFYTEDHEGPSYVVYYCYDPSTKSGYVYLPGRTEKWYWLNIGSIGRGIEGNWFHARASWDSAAEPLILRGENH